MSAGTNESKEKFWSHRDNVTIQTQIKNNELKRADEAYLATSSADLVLHQKWTVNYWIASQMTNDINFDWMKWVRKSGLTWKYVIGLSKYNNYFHPTNKMTNKLRLQWADARHSWLCANPWKTFFIISEFFVISLKWSTGIWTIDGKLPNIR